MTPSESDAELVARTLAGETACFDALVERHVQQLRIYLGSRCRSLEVVDEFSQETWVRAYAGLKTFDTDRVFMGWLIGIARNLIADRARLQQTIGMEGDQLDALVDRSLLAKAEGRADVDRLRHLDECLAKLNKRGQAMLMRHHAEGWTLKRLAQAYKLPAKRLAMQLLRLRNSVRTCVEQQS